MGLDPTYLRFLLSAGSMGYRFESVCTLGRPWLYADPRGLARLLAEYGRCPADFRDRYPSGREQGHADDLFALLGFTRIDSLDYSDYEGATVLHDLNRPCGESLQARYDLVLDVGTIEHVFDFPTALGNAMKMVRPGGHLMLCSPANGGCGHGFYQVSPELYYRALSPENGFEVIRMYLKHGARLYHVVDPALVGGRVTLCGSGATLLYVHARRRADVVPFTTAPQQSDYVSTWSSAPGAGRRRSLKEVLKGVLPRPVFGAVHPYLASLRQRYDDYTWRRASRLSNRRYYVPVERWDVPTSAVTGPPRAEAAASPHSVGC